MKNETKNLENTIQNEGAFAAAICALKISKPSKAELIQIVKELTGLPVRSNSTIKDLYRKIEMHGNSERRYDARAEISRNVMPI